MNCKDIYPKLYLHVDGELAAGEKQAVEEHLRECADCRTLLAAFREENEILSAATTVPSWDAEQLGRLEKQLLRKIKSGQPAIWQEFLGLMADALWLGILVILLCIFMRAVGFNGGILYELAGVGSLTAANKSLISVQLFISGLMLLFILFKYWQFHSLSKKTL